MRCRDFTTPVATRMRLLSMLLPALFVLLGWMGAGSPLAGQEEADANSSEVEQIPVRFGQELLWEVEVPVGAVKILSQPEGVPGRDLEVYSRLWQKSGIFEFAPAAVDASTFSSGGIYTGWLGGCIGFMVGDVFVTAAHCVSKTEGVKNDTFWIGNKFIVECSCYDDDSGIDCNTQYKPDLALCKVVRVGEAHPTPSFPRELNTREVQGNGRFAVAQRGKDWLVSAWKAVPSCSGRPSFYMTLDVDNGVLPGDSGGPVFYGGDVVGVMDGRCYEMEENPALVTRVSDHQVKEWMCKWQSENVKIPGLNGCTP